MTRAAEPVAINGVVTDARTGAPLAGARVEILDSEGSRFALITGRDGRYRAIGLAYGHVLVETDKAGLAPHEVDCRVPSGRSARYDVRMSASFLSIPLRDSCTLEPETSDRYVIE